MSSSVGKRSTPRKVRFANLLVVSLAAILGLSFFPAPAAAQARTVSTPPASRIAGDWRTSPAVQLRSARPRLAKATDAGVAPAGARLERMLLLLEPSAAQKQALDAELAAQLDPSSPQYHRWLTPSAFAATYANTASDVAAVTAWLRASGFQVAAIPAGRGWIEFSGTAAQVEEAFHANIHSYSTAQGARFALTGAVRVPAALEPVIRGLVSLDGALASAAVTTPVPLRTSAAEIAQQTSAARAEALSPALVRQLLDLDAVHAAGDRGAGETIALPSRSNLSAADLSAFRAAFGLPAGRVKVSPSGADPGITADEAATVLAASWAGVAAPDAGILVVPAETTAATDGADLALASIVDRNLARTVAVSYSACEPALGEAHQAFYAALYRQAAAEGIAIVAAAGNSGAAACHAAGSDERVATGYAVNALASTPWNTAVGAVGFGASGLAAWSPAADADPAYAGGGGRSTVYTVPSWQTIAAAGFTRRTLPDVALPAAIDFALSRGLAFCLGGSGSECRLVRAGGSAGSTALFAGLGAVLAGKYGPQGNLAPTLYTVSRAGAGAFDDVTAGDARLACAAGTSGCGASGRIGYAAAAGYDLTSGLGSVNARNLVANWTANPDVGGGKSTVNLLLSPTEPNNTYNPSTKITLAATVVSGTGGATPTGAVTFLDTSSTPATTLGSANLDTSGNASIVIQNLLSEGGHNLQARYNGDKTYAVSTSPTSEGQITIEKSETTIVIVPSTTTPVSGQTITVLATVGVSTPPEGDTPPSGIVTLNLAGGPISYQYTAAVSTTGGKTTAHFSFSIPSGAATFSLQGVYSGDGNYNAHTSAAVTLKLSKSSTTSVLTMDNSSPNAGDTVNVTATVTPSTVVSSDPSGAFTVKLDNAVVGTITLTPGSPSTGSTAIVVPSGGAHVLNGSYVGDSYYSASTAPDVDFTASPDPTSLAVTPSTTTPAPGTSIQVTATMTPQNSLAQTATGNITFTYDGARQGTVPIGAGRTATTTISNLAAGAHTVSASYAGDTNFAASTAPSVTVNVTKFTTTTVLNPATTTPTLGNPLVVNVSVTATQTASSMPSGTVTVTLDGATAGTATLTPGSPSTGSITIPSSSIIPGTHVLAATYNGDTYYSTSIATTVNIVVGKEPTTTTLAASPTDPASGQPVTLTAAISASSYGSSTPSGSVTFKVDGVTNSVQSVTPGSPSTAKATISSLSSGTHALTAVYSGDTYYATSTSPSTSVTVSKGATVTTVSAKPATLTVGETETLIATVAPYDATITSYTITGTVLFYDNGSTLLGRASLTGNTASLAGVSLAVNTNHSITAVYSGDTNWDSSTSSVLLLEAITKPVTVVLTSNVTTSQPGQAVILTATVTPDAPPAASSEQNPSGYVIFYNGSTILGKVALSAVADTFSSVAALTLTDLPGGQDTVYAVYQGDLYYDAATSNLLTLTIQDFTITPSSPNPPNLTIVKGSAGAATFIVTGYGGYNSQVQVVCAVPSQDDMTCTASPQQVTPTSPVTFVVQTFLTGGGTSAARPPRTLWPQAAGGVALAVLGFFLLPYGRRVRIFNGRSSRRLLTFFLLLVGLGGVGIGCTSDTPVITNQGTPLGVATLKITASAYIDNTVYSKSVYLTVNVIPKPTN